MGGSRLGLITRGTRPAALLSAVATLLGALAICLSPLTDHHAPARAAGDVLPTFSCPYESGACGLLPEVSAAVLTSPPPDHPIDAGEQGVRHGGLPGVDRPTRSGALARAPDLHVLQVLRT
ncbi:hypothetical protein ABZ348_20680 [Streptomyces sp. NPDC005963]|uniref:hypothetical protein n=1 Tax=Streptomyces sp. NPDC005963 TaxID=3156721 RepID=UPI0033F62C7B